MDKRHRHPLGILPAGNFFFADKDDQNRRRNGLGEFINRLSDELLLELLSYLCASSLSQLMIASKALYVYAQSEDLWRDLLLRKVGEKSITYVNNWKFTFIAASSGKDFRTNKPLNLIKASGIYSDLLHRSWLCHEFDIAESCPGFLDFADIPRVSAANLSVEDFVSRYEIPNLPVIITGAVSEWPAFTKWTDEYLISTCKDALFRATSATAPLPASFTMAHYIAYRNQAHEEAPLYLFERDFPTLVPPLANDYTPPPYFSATAAHGSDLFRLLGEGRPDHRWLIAGPARSGSLFHIDPNQTNAWNVSIRGRKKWIFYPPHGQPPPGVASSPDGADVAVPISTGEWLLAFWKEHLDRRKEAKEIRPLEAVVKEGEVIFVPHGYWHMVVNLDPCLALTHNYVSTSNLDSVLRFLREKPDQVSGLRDRREMGRAAVDPNELLEIFERRLKEEGISSREVGRCPSTPSPTRSKDVQVLSSTRLVGNKRGLLRRPATTIAKKRVAARDSIEEVSKGSEPSTSAATTPFLFQFHF